MAVRKQEVQRFVDAWMGMRQLVQAANFNRFQRAGLSATQFMTLNVLPANGPGMTLTELARRLNLSAATLNKTVESLEGRGLVTRTRRTTDARKLDIVATEEGNALQNAASAEFREFVAGLFAKLPEASRAGLLDGMEALLQAAPGEGAAAGRERMRKGGAPAVTRRGGDAPREKRSSRQSPRQ